MEKFSGFRDPGTGIQPFLHPKPRIATPTIIWIIKYVLFGAIVAPIRMALLVLLSVLHAAISTFIQYLVSNQINLIYMLDSISLAPSSLL